MNSNFDPYEQIRSSLSRLREDPKTQRKFPKEIWMSIIELTKTFPAGEVCRQLAIHPTYLKQKIREFQDSPVEFQELTLERSPADFICIELSTGSGLKAKIEGPLSALKCLHQVFGG
jgi:hypothetical protein